jgi:DNA polymerase III subunit delta'
MPQLQSSIESKIVGSQGLAGGTWIRNDLAVKRRIEPEKLRETARLRAHQIPQDTDRLHHQSPLTRRWMQPGLDGRPARLQSLGIRKFQTRMAFKDIPRQTQGVQLLQRSLARGRLGHAYLFTGDQMEDLELVARTLAKILNCLNPVKMDGVATDCCDECPTCRKIDHETHGDIHWARPESKSRVITVEQMRDLMQQIQLKPTEAEYKVIIIAGADRLNPQAANTFLKTLEEPPAKSILILLSTEPSRILETILSRCLRLNFSGDGARRLDAAQSEWLGHFGALAANEQKSLLGRYRLLDALLQKLGEIRSRVDESLTARSPLEKYDEVEKDLREKWEKELAAGIEAEYRRHRADLLLLIQWWLHDVWLHTLDAGKDLLKFQDIAGAETVARRINPRLALENLQTLEQTQRLLHSNVQEALALEVGMLKLHF